MTDVPNSLDVERFRAAVARRLGLQFDDTKLGFLREVLRQRLSARGSDSDVYLDHLERQISPNNEAAALAEQLTVGETYFFRHMEQFDAFVRTALPDRLRAQATSRRLRILSVGCASGEEPYSLAILASECGAGPGWDVSIRGMDANPAFLARASEARYSAWSLRETSPDVRRRWFRPDGRDFMLDEGIRAAVAFELRNLADENGDLWQPDSLDVVFCRNVIMYFTPEAARALMARIARALAPGGYLFLGHAETLRGLSQGFNLRHTHGTFYYQRKDELDGAEAEPTAPVQGGRPDVRSSPALAAGNDATWVDTIQRATRRIQSLVHDAAQKASIGAAVNAPPAGRPAVDRRLVLELVGKERFADALELLRECPPEAKREPDVLLIHAALLTQSGQFSRAESVCASLIEIEELNAGAHYLLALCREGSGDRRAAVEHDQIAAYLDPAFAMPRLHLGLLARHVGDQETARRELSQALVLLQREDASRLLLFGGGFGRGALIDLCRAGLAVCGGAP